jgi:hypothetical protein
MTEQEFAALSPISKWNHLKTTMDFIMKMDAKYELRRRYNTHHSDEQVKEERRSLRTDQYQRWAHIKALYATNRDELNNTLGNPEFEEAKSIFEKVFTEEVDTALRGILDEE